MRYPTDPQPAVALGLVLLAPRLAVPCVQPARLRKSLRAGLREVQQLGWPVTDRGGCYALPADVRRAALRDGGVDWAGAVLSGVLVRRDGPFVELKGAAL